jgi:hypothetical protein
VFFFVLFFLFFFVSVTVFHGGRNGSTASFKKSTELRLQQTRQMTCGCLRRGLSKGFRRVCILRVDCLDITENPILSSSTCIHGITGFLVLVQADCVSRTHFFLLILLLFR